ncbi:MAG TPA: ABC transporter permease [Phycisphaerales bacterium]|nr:ABC transporter permease [Phycisphaerales bacterium]
MIALILRRLIQAPLILLAVYTITFALAWALPGSAIIRDEGRRPPEAVLAAMESRYNLDSAPTFYVQYLARATGVKWLIEQAKGADGHVPDRVFDLGPSLRYEDWSVNDLLAGTLPVSLILGFSAVAIALFLGLAAGILGSIKPRSLLDAATLALALIGVSLPSFVIGTVLLLVFPVWLGWGRVGSWGSPTDLILPALTLALPFAAYIARLTRLGMIEALNSDYARTARAKGVPQRTIVLTHALKNAFLPVLSYLGPATSFAVTGSFVVESVFNVPGLGRHFVSAVQNKDLFVIMGVTLVFSAILVTFNLAVDILYRWVDPRIE